MARRSAITLIEVLIVIGIVAIMIALLLPAIQNIRASAAKVQSANNLKQIDLAAQHFAETYSGNLPILNGGGRKRPTYRQSVFVALLPYVEQGAVFDAYKAATGGSSSDFTIRLYLSPADPTISVSHAPGLCSYAANSQVFVVAPSMNHTFRDGTSSTIVFAEHYASDCDKTVFHWFSIIPDVFPDGSSIHRAAFADNGPLVRKKDRSASPNAFQDAYPITSGNPPQSVSSLPGLTFQAHPSRANCDPRLAQTPHSGGMLAAYADGSVRTLSPGTSETAFWGAVTPAGGEIIKGD